MKKKMFFTSDASNKGGSKPDDHKEKHDHMTQVKHELESLKKKLDHALEKKWISQEDHDAFAKMNQESTAFVDAQLA